MGEETRKQALAKLATFGRKIGYPDRWRDYSALEIGTAGWFENIREAVAFESRHDLSKVGKPVDRGEWLMSPPTVNLRPAITPSILMAPWPILPASVMPRAM